MTESTSKPASSQLILEASAIPLIDSVVDALSSENSRRAYRQAISHLSAFAKGKPITRALLLRWRTSMNKAALSSSTVNVRLSAARKLIEEARRLNMLDAADAAEMLRIDGMPRRGSRTGNWLTQDEARQLLAVPDRKTLKGKRSHCILSVLLGCALRREELGRLQMATVQRREGRWVLADVEGKGGRVRTVAVPAWVKNSIDTWTKAANITSGLIVRRLSGEGDGLSDEAIARVVRLAGVKIGMPTLSPHDLRRTCAKLCRAKGGALEQIQLMLGHESIQTTERYLGSEQDLKTAVNDDLGF